MPDPVAAAQVLTETQRVVETFTAPTRTFTDVRRKASWWLPYLLTVLCAYALTWAIQLKVGWPLLTQNEIRVNQRLTERLAGMPPEQVVAVQRTMRLSFQYGFWAAPLTTLASIALAALILWGTINFVFGGSATYGRTFCVAMYAWLPTALSTLLAAALLFAGRDPASFTTQAMLGSNPGYYLDTPGALKTALNATDLFTIWSAILMAIGLSIVAGTKRSAGYYTVFAWFILIVGVRTALAAINS